MADFVAEVSFEGRVLGQGYFWTEPGRWFCASPHYTLTQVTSRFGVVVTQKVAAQTVPVVGALGGAAVNYAFIEHFQEVARGHFTVRRLERVYGKDVVRTEYERLAQHR